MRYFKYLLIFILFYNCKKAKNTIVFNQFNETISLKSTPIEIKENIFPFFMGILNDTIILCDTQLSPHFYTYKLPGFSLVGSFGKQGLGPKEIEDPVFWGQLNNKNNSLDILFYQMNKMKFTTFNLKKALQNSLSEKDFTVTYMPPEIADAVNILELQKNYFVGSGSTLLGEFFIYNQKEDKLKWFDFINDFDKEFMNSLKVKGLLGEYKRGIIKVKPDRSKFVKVYNYTSRINIFNNKGKLILTIKNSNSTKPNLLSNQFDFKTKTYYNNVFLTDKYIYALYLNCTLEQYKEGNYNSVEIHMFDWNGNPLKKIKLNESIGPMSPFVIDELNHKIYTVNPKTENSYFSSFSLK